MGDLFGVGLPPGALSSADLLELIQADQPLLSGLGDLERQLQPNGVDLRLEAVWQTDGPGLLGIERREPPARRPLPFDSSGWLHLPPGAYGVRLCETVRLPLDLLALAWPRSSLLRAGATILTAVWDAGYHGRSEALLTVFNPDGFRLERGARVIQMVFFRLSSPSQGYDGAYQGEGLA